MPPVGAAEQAHRELGAPCPHQPGDADDLAAADIHIDALDHLPLGVERVVDRPVLHLEDDFADLGVARREAVFERPAHHRGDDPVFADLAFAQGLDRLPVTDDGDVIGDAVHFIELVRDEN